MVLKWCFGRLNCHFCARIGQRLVNANRVVENMVKNFRRTFWLNNNRTRIMPLSVSAAKVAKIESLKK